jgi:hypothetical protein
MNMKLSEIIKQLDLTTQTKTPDLKVGVTGGYVSDMLSDVMANTNKGNIWITLQIHQNTVAVAVLKELAGIILINGKQPAAETIHKAEQENIPIMSTELSAFDLICKLCKLGISGSS